MNRSFPGAAFVAVLSMSGCASQNAAVSPAKTINLTVDPSGKMPTDANTLAVLKGVQMIQAGQAQAAIDGPLTDVVKRFEAMYDGKPVKVYCARGMVDGLVYAGTVNKIGKAASRVEVLGPAWAMAYWARGYAYNEMGRYDQARVELEKALALSPMDSQYKIELGYAYQKTRDWAKSLDIYGEAEGDADITAADVPETKCKALRGQGYDLVELNRLDEATQKYQACLVLKPGEQKSRNEISYIQELRAKRHRGSSE